MSKQSRTVQRQIIEDARKDGTFNQLYWYVSYDMPLRVNKSTAEQLTAAAKHRGGVPVIRVAPDPAASEAEVDLLRWQFEDANRGRGLSFHYTLTRPDLLDKFTPGWYVWGEENTSIDNICPECGQIHATEHHELWACCGWSQVLRVEEKS